MKGDAIITFIVLVLALIGIVTLWVGSHEMVHVSQFKSENKSIESICFVGYNVELNNSLKIGWVQGFSSNEEFWQPDETPAKWVGNITALILFLITLYYFIVINVKKNKK